MERGSGTHPAENNSPLRSGKTGSGSSGVFCSSVQARPSCLLQAKTHGGQPAHPRAPNHHLRRPLSTSF
ncbi:unnamed protein product [Linum tenue]|uniref:Uncharacterized protein n=1 Tax=Linum tenue TaxID=586396 RepID=A0AAV0KVJ7_9ROSI|nr:unnamed protein product [Linum tenue]